jgi:ubiquinone/menaquinone biosynthesis C-methylase UbiE
MNEKIQKFWDKNAGRYDVSERKSEAVNKDIIAKTINYLNPTDHVLDFGCATGTKAIALAGHVRHIHGLDISTEMINLAIKKKDALNIPNISFSQGTIFSKEFEPASFDKIVSFAVIHLLEDKEEAARRIHELLKPGGLFISVTACFKDKMAFKNKLEFLSFLMMKKIGLVPLHLNMFSTTDVENLLTNQHFNILVAEKIFDGISISFVVARKQNN